MVDQQIRTINKCLSYTIMKRNVIDLKLGKQHIFGQR